jgi:hypothetical protein
MPSIAKMTVWSVRPIHWARVAAPQDNIRLGAGHEEGRGERETVKAGEIQVAPIRNVESAGLDSDVVKSVNIMQLLIGDPDVNGEMSMQVEQYVHIIPVAFCLRNLAQGNSAKHKPIAFEYKRTSCGRDQRRAGPRPTGVAQLQSGCGRLSRKCANRDSRWHRATKSETP